MEGCANHKEMTEEIKKAKDFTIDYTDKKTKTIKDEITGRIRHMEEGLKRDINGVHEKLSGEMKEMTNEYKEDKKEREKNREEFIETRTWVKALFGQFERVIEKMDEMTQSMKQHEVNQAAEEATTKAETKSNNRAAEFGRKLVYKIVEYVLITIVLGTIFTMLAK